VKSILYGIVDLNRVHIRNYKTICNIFLDHARKKIIALWMNDPKNLRIGLMRENNQTEGKKIDRVEEIYDYRDMIIERVKFLEKTK